MLPRGRQPAALHPPLMWLTEALNDMQIKKKNFIFILSLLHIVGIRGNRCDIKK